MVCDEVPTVQFVEPFSMIPRAHVTLHCLDSPIYITNKSNKINRILTS